VIFTTNIDVRSAYRSSQYDWIFLIRKHLFWDASSIWCNNWVKDSFGMFRTYWIRKCLSLSDLTRKKTLKGSINVEKKLFSIVFPVFRRNGATSDENTFVKNILHKVTFKMIPDMNYFVKRAAWWGSARQSTLTLKLFLSLLSQKSCWIQRKYLCSGFSYRLFPLKILFVLLSTFTSVSSRKTKKFSDILL